MQRKPCNETACTRGLPPFGLGEQPKSERTSISPPCEHSSLHAAWNVQGRRSKGYEFASYHYCLPPCMLPLMELDRTASRRILPQALCTPRTSIAAMRAGMLISKELIKRENLYENARCCSKHQACTSRLRSLNRGHVVPRTLIYEHNMRSGIPQEHLAESGTRDADTRDISEDL